MREGGQVPRIAIAGGSRAWLFETEYLVAKKGFGGELVRPRNFTLSWLTPPPVPRFRPRGASFRERVRPLRTPPKLPPVPWPRPLPSLARGARCGNTPCRFRQG